MTGSPGPALPRPVILDCDPGIDDAFAIVFGCGHPGLDLRGITTVAGNAGLAATTANALSVLEFVGCDGVPVVAGCPAPLLRPARDGSSVHGETGLGGARLPAPRGSAAPGHAVDFLIEEICAAPGEITLVATGPLTNIALALRRYPPLAGLVADFVIMGGTTGRGNLTAAAEFNIAHDPEAASIVFGAGWQVTMVGLDVTLQARAGAVERERMRGLSRLGRELLLASLAGYHGDPSAPAPPVPASAASRAGGTVPGGTVPGGTASGASGDPGAAGAAGDEDPPVHDVCALALVAEPGLFGCLPARVDVETAGVWTSGMTVTEFRDTGRPPNALVALSIDVPAFWDVVLGAYARLPVAG